MPCVPACLPCPQDAFLERHGVKLGFMSAFVKAAGAALQYVPAVNGVIDGNEIIYRWAGISERGSSACMFLPLAFGAARSHHACMQPACSQGGQLGAAAAPAPGADHC